MPFSRTKVHATGRRAPLPQLPAIVWHGRAQPPITPRPLLLARPILGKDFGARHERRLVGERVILRLLVDEDLAVERDIHRIPGVCRIVETQRPPLTFGQLFFGPRIDRFANPLLIPQTREDRRTSNPKETLMCRCLAYSGAPVLLDEVLFKTEHSLTDQSLRFRNASDSV